MKRRSFLQRVGWVLAALGVGEAGIMRSGFSYYQALAQPTRRKLALLVGINQYLDFSLAGCVTDVELQRELLIHRFGFEPSDILTLTDAEATAQNIETAFGEHLTKQTKTGDVVVFHFSGYGSRIEGLSSGEIPTGNLLLSADGLLSNNLSVVNGVGEETWRLLLRSLATQSVTTVLDTSFTDPGTLLWGNLRVRSGRALSGQLSDRELALQKQLQQNQLTTQIPGVVLTAAGPNQLAMEGQIDGFSAGIFTYALTQYLWQVTPPTTVRVCLHEVRQKVVQIVGKVEQPIVVDRTNPDRELVVYYILPTNRGADGVVLAVENDGKTVQLWLGGLPLAVLGFYGVNSIFTLLPLDDEKPNTWQLVIRDRKGLNAVAEVYAYPNGETPVLQAGQLVQEAVRVLPRDIGLKVALDASLERIERVDATSAFSGIPNLVLVNAGEDAADCVLGRVQVRELGTVEASVSSSNLVPQYGLYSAGGNLLPNTAGEAGEAVKTAVQRLVPKLQMLLAAKLWGLSENEGSSRLGVGASLEMLLPKEQVLMERTTHRASGNVTTIASLPTAMNSSGILSLPVGCRIQYRLYNYGDSPLYFLLLGTDSNGSPIALLPAKSAADSNNLQPTVEFSAIAAGESIIVPDVSSPYKWLLQGPPGLTEMQVIFSRKPFDRTFAVLASTESIGNYERIVNLFAPLDVARSVMEDLHQASVAEKEIFTDSDFYLDVNAWATLTFIYEVV